MKPTVILPIYKHEGLEQALQNVGAAFSDRSIHLVGLFSRPGMEQITPYGARSYASASKSLAQARANAEALADECKKTFEAFMLPSGSTTEWRDQVDLTAFDLRQHALFADIIVLPGSTREADRKDIGFDYNTDLLAHLISNTSVAVLLLPPEGVSQPVFAKPMLAWKMAAESASAAKALTRLAGDQTPLNLVTVTRQPLEGISSWSAAEMSQYLQRQDLKVEENIIVLRDGDVGQTLIDHGEKSDTSLIVSGGFGRQKWLEFLFGGVTRSLINNCRKPILFAH